NRDEARARRRKNSATRRCGYFGNYEPPWRLLRDAMERPLMARCPNKLLPPARGASSRCAPAARPLGRSLGLFLLGVAGAQPCFAASSEFVDTAASWLALFIIIVVPIGGIVLFWLVHILPEKFAHQRHHPQLAAIKTLCLLSLVFGGILWPLAWLWAFTKPVLHQAAYGRDKHDDYYEKHGQPIPAGGAAPAPAPGRPRRPAKNARAPKPG